MSAPMNEAATCLTHHVRFRRRLFIYIALWLLAALAFQVFLRPLGLTETDLTPIQQRIRWPLYTPLMAVIGLAQAGTWPANPQAIAGIAAAAVFVLHAVSMLTRARPRSLIALAAAHALLLALAVIYYVRWSQLPSGP